MIWHILGAVSLFLNIAKTDELGSNNSKLILINKNKLESNKTKIASSNLKYSSENPSPFFFIQRKIQISLSRAIKDTIHKDDLAVAKEVRIINKTAKLTVITYRIYFNGTIEKHIPKVITSQNQNKYKYEYLTKNGNIINLGSYKIYKTIAFKGHPGEYVNLINLESVPKYFKQNNYQYHFNIDSRRSFVNEQTLASFFGAMLEVNYLDISCNGFSHKDGSSKPSRSHINGNNGDFKYLRLNKTLECGPGTSLNINKAPDSLDYSRQNKWNDALYKFGWKEMLGWTYTIEKKTKKLHYVDHKTTNHHHHLHVQKYEPDYKEIKQ